MENDRLRPAGAVFLADLVVCWLHSGREVLATFGGTKVAGLVLWQRKNMGRA
jgi:hypothetical protein